MGWVNVFIRTVGAFIRTARVSLEDQKKYGTSLEQCDPRITCLPA